MPRKSAKGKIKICKALNLDGSKCLTHFEVHQHQASKHKFCSEKCRKRDFRLKAKKKIHAKTKKEEKLKNLYKKSEGVKEKISVVFNQLSNDLRSLIEIRKPIKQLEKKFMFDEKFGGIGGIQNYNNYEGRRRFLEQKEQQRKSNLEYTSNQLILSIKNKNEAFGELINSEKLKLVITDEYSAILKDNLTKLIKQHHLANIFIPAYIIFS